MKIKTALFPIQKVRIRFSSFPTNRPQAVMLARPAEAESEQSRLMENKPPGSAAELRGADSVRSAAQVVRLPAGVAEHVCCRCVPVTEGFWGQLVVAICRALSLSYESVGITSLRSDRCAPPGKMRQTVEAPPVCQENPAPIRSQPIAAAALRPACFTLSPSPSSVAGSLAALSFPTGANSTHSTFNTNRHALRQVYSATKALLFTPDWATLKTFTVLLKVNHHLKLSSVGYRTFLSKKLEPPTSVRNYKVILYYWLSWTRRRFVM